MIDELNKRAESYADSLPDNKPGYTMQNVRKAAFDGFMKGAQLVKIELPEIKAYFNYLALLIFACTAIIVFTVCISQPKEKDTPISQKEVVYKSSASDSLRIIELKAQIEVLASTNAASDSTMALDLYMLRKQNLKLNRLIDIVVKNPSQIKFLNGWRNRANDDYED